LPKGKLSLTRKDVESGKVGKYTDEEYNLYARHGKFSFQSNTESNFD
jgi:glycerol-3-phosphate dehydrogenase